MRRIWSISVFLLGMSFVMCSCQEAEKVPQSKAESVSMPGKWQLGVQAYTFRRFTFYEAVDKTAELGLKYIEAYPGQRLSPQKNQTQFSHLMSPELRKEVKAKLADSGVKLVGYGVVPLTKNEQESRAVFDFAQKMGVGIIIAEPPEDAFDVIEKLCREYDIKVAIHNHPKRKSSHYWNPETVAAVCKGRSNLIGACPDIGHWIRSEIQPVEALKKLEGRLISFHFKDVEDFGNVRARDVVFGTGVTDFKALLAEVERQGFEGPFMIEYESHSPQLMTELEKSAAFLKKKACKY